MTGPSGGPQGMNAQRVIEHVLGRRTGELPPEGPAEGEIVLGAVLLEIEDGLTRSVRRLG
jgi:hypothetical protein